MARFSAVLGDGGGGEGGRGDGGSVRGRDRGGCKVGGGRVGSVRGCRMGVGGLAGCTVVSHSPIVHHRRNRIHTWIGSGLVFRVAGVWGAWAIVDLGRISQ